VAGAGANARAYNPLTGAGVGPAPNSVGNYVLVISAAATQLQFMVQPATTHAGEAIAPAVQVALKDPLGNLVTTSAVSVTLTLAANPGNTNLAGTVTTAANHGIATFNDLSLDVI